MTSEIRANTLKNRVGLGTVSFTNTGPVVSGIVTATGATFTSGNVQLASDSQRLQLGSGQDLWMYHTGTSGGGHGLIQNDYGTMYMLSDNFTFRDRSTNHDVFRISQNNSVSLFYQNSAKLSTTNTGVSVSGTLVAGALDISGDIDVDGHTNLDNVSIVGIATVTGSSQINFGGGTTQLQISNSNDSDINHNESNGSGLRFRINGQTQMVVKTDSITYGANLHNYYTNRVAVHSGDIDTFIGFPANDTFSIETGGNEVFNITYNRIGLNGTIPTASHANVTSSIHLADSNTILSRTGNQYFALFQNLKYTSADAIRYLVNGYASAYAQNAGTHRFYTVGNGTGNTNATVTERLRITNDGKVGINRTSPVAPITARRTDAGGTGTSGVIAEFANSSGYGVWFGQSSASGASWGATTGDFYWNTGGLSSQVERLRIESNGNLKVTTGTQYKGVNVCKADGGLVAELVGLSGSNDTGAVSLWSGGSKYVQISAIGNSYINGGNFGVGTASPGTSFVVEKSDASGLTAHILVNNSQSNAGISLLGSGSSFSSGGWAAVTDAGIIRSSANASNGLVLQAASGNLRFYAGGNPPAERLRIQSDGKLLIGSTNPSNNARLGNELCIVGTEAYTGMSITNYPGTNASHAPLFDFNRSRGTSDQSMTSVAGGDKLGEIIFRGSNGSAFVDAVTLRAYADSVGGGHVDGRYEISTSQGGSMDIRFRVNENGHITAPNNVAFSARNGPSDVTDNVIIFGTLVFQRGGGNYDTSTGIFTAPVDGIYHFMCNPYRYETSADSMIMLEKSTNGGSSWTYELEIRRTNNYGGDNGRGWNTLTLSQIMDLNANDQVRIRAVNRIHCNGVYSRFSGYLVA